MNGRFNSAYLIGLAMSGAAFTMAYQVAGKAARDALFLSNFRSHHLPAMIVAAAAAAIVLGVVNSRFLSEFAPGRLIPILMITSGGLQAVEWFTYSFAPQATAVAVYIHVISLGAVITSGFWSVISEQLDPYTARRNFGRIAAAGTAGGVAGGFVAERIAAWTQGDAVLLFMAAVQILTSAALIALPRSSAVRPARVRVRARDVLRRSSYLRNLSYLVVLGTFAAALLDFLLKSQARSALGPGEALMRFFAMFHTATALLSFVLQTGATPQFLNRFGVGATVGTLPAAVTGSGALALFAGGFWAIVLARGVEAVVRGSLFRAGYELFYTPMPASEKRAVKSINDVTIDRLGDGLGGGFAQLMVSTAGSLGTTVMLGTAVGASAVGLALAGRLHAAYINSLERSLAQHADQVELSEEEDDSEDLVFAASSGGGLDTRPLAARQPVPVPAAPWFPEIVRKQWMDIQSADRERIKGALTAGPALHRAFLPHVIPLLGRRSVAEAAAQALEAVADRNIGQLSDHLLDDEIALAVRSKLPPIIAATGGIRAFDALIQGLRDKHFEIRAECGRALDELKQTTKLDVDPDRVYSAIRDELGRTSEPNLQHIFSLLSVVLPRRPVRVALEALDVDDPQLRGLALEYLESALPPDIGGALLASIERPPEDGMPIPQPKTTPHRLTGGVREELLSVLQQCERSPNRDNS